MGAGREKRNKGRKVKRVEGEGVKEKEGERER